MPPVSKHTPLPMKAIGAASFLPPFQRITTTRLSCTEPCPTRERVHPELLHRRHVEDVDRDAEPLEGAGAAGELRRIEHVRRLVDQVAREQHRIGERVLGRPGAARARHVGDADVDLEGRRLLLVLLALGLVAVEPVAAQPHAEAELARLLGRHRLVGQLGQDGGAGGGGRDLAHRDAAELDEILALHVGRLAAPDHHQPRRLEVGRRQQVEGTSALALEAIGRGRAGDQGCGRPEQAAGYRPELQRLVTEHHENTGTRQRKCAETNRRAVGHEAILSNGKNETGLCVVVGAALGPL